MIIIISSKVNHIFIFVIVLMYLMAFCWSSIHSQISLKKHMQLCLSVLQPMLDKRKSFERKTSYLKTSVTSVTCSKIQIYFNSPFVFCFEKQQCTYYTSVTGWEYCAFYCCQHNSITLKCQTRFQMLQKCETTSYFTSLFAWCQLQGWLVHKMEF